MKFTDLNHYGYRKAIYDECIDLIRDTNRRHMEILNMWFMLITAVYMVLSLQNTLGLSSVNTPLFMGFLAVEAGFQAVLVWADRYVRRHMVLVTYVNIFGLLAFGTICSVARPYMAATIYPVILVIVALSYMERFFRMLAALIFGSAVFLLFSYLVKPGSIFNQDVFNVLVVFALSTALQYTFQHARMRQFIVSRETIRFQQELEIGSSFDNLTGLLSRGRFFFMAEEAMRQDTEEMAVLGIIDLDRFKDINDSLGHQMGDKLIQTVGTVIDGFVGADAGDRWSYPERAVRNGLNFAARLGSDEFAVLVRGLHRAEEAGVFFDSLLKKLNEIRMDGVEGIGASIGVAVIGRNERDIDRAYSRANAALYASKESGRNRITLSGGV